MNPLLIAEKESFKGGIDSLDFFRERLVKLTNGGILYCTSGEADIIIDLQRHHIVVHTSIVLVPGSIISVASTSKDFIVHYFAFSKEMMKNACFRLEPAFIRFLKESPCYTHNKPEIIKPILQLIDASIDIYKEKENIFRDNIAQNMLQIFLFNTYDKVQRHFTKEQLEGRKRKGQLFKKFIQLVHTHCVDQRDVVFYAEKLCISTRYLSAITKAMGAHSTKSIIDDFLILEIKVTLQSTNLSLKEIAERYHFPDQSFFGRYFKKHTGMSPKDYRLKYISI